MFALFALSNPAMAGTEECQYDFECGLATCGDPWNLHTPFCDNGLCAVGHTDCRFNAYCEGNLIHYGDCGPQGPGQPSACFNNALDCTQFGESFRCESHTPVPPEHPSNTAVCIELVPD